MPAARTNKSRFAILGMLSRQPMAGYDILKGLEKAGRAFWSESAGQVYPMLQHLLKQGLVTVDILEQNGKPDKLMYTITPAGRDELANWLKSPTEMPKYRVEFLLKLFFGHEVPVENSIAMLEAFRDGQRGLLAEYQQMRCFLEKGGQDIDPDCSFYSLLTLHCGIRISLAYINWADQAIIALKARQEGSIQK